MAGGVEGAIRAAAAEVVEERPRFDAEGRFVDYPLGDKAIVREALRKLEGQATPLPLPPASPSRSSGSATPSRAGFSLGVRLVMSIAVALGLGLGFWLVFETWAPADRARVLGALAPPVVTVLVFLALFGVPSFLLLRARDRRESRDVASAWRGNDAVVARALAQDYAAVFRNGRARIDVTFKIQLGILVLLALVLVAGLAGVIAASLARQIGVAAGSGSASVVGLISSKVLQPYAEIRKALADAQRLDRINASLSDQLDQCSSIKDDDERRKCTSKVWAEASRQLKTMT